MWTGFWKEVWEGGGAIKIVQCNGKEIFHTISLLLLTNNGLVHLFKISSLNACFKINKSDNWSMGRRQELTISFFAPTHKQLKICLPESLPTRVTQCTQARFSCSAPACLLTVNLEDPDPMDPTQFASIPKLNRLRSRTLLIFCDRKKTNKNITGFEQSGFDRWRLKNKIVPGQNSKPPWSI